MASHKYENVQLTSEDHDHDHSSRSSTEVESLMGEEKSWQAQQLREKSKTRGLASILRSSRWMLDTTLLFIILALLVRNQMKEAPTSPTDLVQLNGDMTGVGPRCAFDGSIQTGQDIRADQSVQYSSPEAYPIPI